MSIDSPTRAGSESSGRRQPSGNHRFSSVVAEFRSRAKGIDIARSIYCLVCFGLSVGMISAIADSLGLATRAPLKRDLGVAIQAGAAVAARVAVPYALLSISTAIALLMLARVRVAGLLLAIACSTQVFWLVEHLRPGTAAGSYARALVSCAVFVCFTAIIYLLTGFPRIDTARRRRYWAILAGCVPVVLVEIWLLEWFVANPRTPGGGPPFWIYAAYVAVTFVTLSPAIYFGRGLGAWRLASLSIALAALVPAVIWYSSEAPPERVLGEVRKPTVFLITVDSLRADALSAYGSPLPTTHFDALARDAIVFERAVAPASWTVPSMMSVMTGVTPFVHDVGRGHDPFHFKRYKGPLSTWAQILSDEGYTSLAVIGNPLLDDITNVTDGLKSFDVLDGLPVGTNAGGIWLAGRDPLRYISGGSTRALTDAAIDLIREHADEQLFLWLHYYDPHWPYAPPPEYSDLPRSSLARWAAYDQEKAFNAENKFSSEERDEIQSLYLSEVQYVDDNLGRLWQVLREEGLYDTGIIVLTSDHGEEFWEHGRLGHGHALHAETVNVPLMVKLPRSKSTRSVRSVVSTQALLPTILDLLEIEVQRSPAWLPSLAALTVEDAPDRYPSLLLGAGAYKLEDLEMLIRGETKVLRWTQSDLWRAYDLAHDPGETRPLQGSRRQDVIREARAALEAAKSEADALRKATWGADVETENEQETLDRLRSLGYL